MHAHICTALTCFIHVRITIFITLASHKAADVLLESVQRKYEEEEMYLKWEKKEWMFFGIVISPISTMCITKTMFAGPP